MATNNLDDDRSPSAFFTRILLQSGRYSASNPQQQPGLQGDAEGLLVKFASLFAQDLVSKASRAAQNRSGHSIHLNDVNFVLKHQWPIYDSSSYHRVAEN